MKFWNRKPRGLKKALPPAGTLYNESLECAKEKMQQKIDAQKLKNENLDIIINKLKEEKAGI